MKGQIKFCLGFLTILTVSLFGGEEKVLFDQDVQPGGQLHLIRLVGEVSITGTTGNHVRITENISTYSNRRDQQSPDFSTVKFEGGKIIISGNPGTVDYHALTAEIPMLFSVAVDGAGGNISVDNITGEVLIRIAGGDTELKKIRGLVTVNTSAGDVTMRDIQGRASVTTQGGDLDLSNFVGNVDLKNNAGDITITEGTGNVHIQSGSGDLFVGELKGDSLMVNLNAGDLSLEGYEGRGVFILNYGNVDIENMIGSLNVNLDMGSMAIQRLQGKLDARLKVGNLEVVRHEGSGLVRIDRGDVDYDWAVKKTDRGDSLTIDTKVGSVYFGYNRETNPSLILETTSEVDGLEELQGKVTTTDVNRHRAIYIYSGSKEKATISTKVGRIRIYER